MYINIRGTEAQKAYRSHYFRTLMLLRCNQIIKADTFDD